MRDSVKVFAPATVANVACGFDILGFAVQAPGDEVILRPRPQAGLAISDIQGDEGRLSRDPQKNTVSVSILSFLRHIGQEGLGLDLQLHKKMPFGSGLGSSAASAVAGVFAANALLGEPLSREALLPFAMEGERIACGSAHADNVGPSLYGGFVLVRSYQPLDVVRIPVPSELVCTLVHPQLEVPTRDARNILKREIPLSDAIVQWGNVGGLIAGLCQSDYGLVSRSLQDVVAEPLRAMLIPGFEQVRAAALQAGALGMGISGSGPSLFALSRGEETAQQVGIRMQQAFGALGIESELFVSRINDQGVQVIG